MLRAIDYAIARSQPRERPKIIVKTNYSPAVYRKVGQILDLLGSDFSLLPPEDGWKEKELYLTHRVAHCPYLFGRVHLNVTAQGKRLGRKNLRFGLFGTQGQLWKFRYTLTNRDYFTVLMRKGQALVDLRTSWEPCLFHPSEMNLRVNIQDRLEWYCEQCDAIAYIPAVLHHTVHRLTPEKFWLSRKS